MTTPELPSLPPQDRRRVLRAAALRPLNLLVIFIGAGIFLTTSAWWVPLIAIPTYLSLVALASRDPVFQGKALGSTVENSAAITTTNAEVSPERRARWLPRGATREKVEAALEAYRKIISAIDESDEVTQTVLEDTIPKLHATAERLVDAAQRREKTAAELRTQTKHSGAKTEERAASLSEMEADIRKADAEISATLEKLLTLRAKVVRISIVVGGEARDAADSLNESLDELNFRLEALGQTMPIQEEFPSDSPTGRDASTERDA